MTLKEYFIENQSLLIATIAVFAGCLLIIAAIVVTHRCILKKKREKEELSAASEALIRSAYEITNKQMLFDTVLPDESKNKEISDLNDDGQESTTENASEQNDTNESSTDINESDLTHSSAKNVNAEKNMVFKSKDENANKTADTLQLKSAGEKPEKEQKSADKPIINEKKPLQDNKSSDERQKESTSKTAETATQKNEKNLKKNIHKDQKNEGEKFRPTRSKQSQNSEKPTSKYAGKWLIYTENGKYAANLVASNGEVLLRSESYTALSGIKSGIETIKNNIAKNNFAISVDKNGNFFFKLYSSSTRLLCISEGYSTKAVCESAIESVKRFSQTAVLEIKKEENQ